MTFRIFRIPAAFVLVTALPAVSLLAQTRASAPASPYGGVTVEEIIARVNDQVISSSDYQRAMQEMDQEARQKGASMQEISEGHKDLLRNLIDQQLWLSKGKELGITGETELVNKLNEIRKQYNLASMEDLEKAARDQGVSYEDFKANIRNQIVTQEVMRQEVGQRIHMTPGEVERYFDQHKQDYAQQENVKLSEILVSTGTAGATDAQKQADAQAKANEIEGKLRAGADFAQLARTSSEATTAAQDGDLGTYKRGQLGKVFEDATFGLKPGEFTEPILTKQGYVILKVISHTQGGVPEFKDVQSDVEQNYFMSRMEPAIREYLTTMRDDASIETKTGYVDTGASPNKQIFPIAYSSYTPPSSKKKHKVERTRFRETAHSFRQKTKPATLAADDQTQAPAPTAAEKNKKKASKNDQAALEKPGKKEKIRFGKAPTKTLPSTPASTTEDAGASTETANANEPVNPLETNEEPRKKSRFSDRAKQPKQAKKTSQQQRDALTPQAPDAAEVADRQTQSSALGLNGDQNAKKKKKETATGDKTRLSERKKSEEQTAPPQPTPVPPVQGAPAPASAPPPQQ